MAGPAIASQLTPSPRVTLRFELATERHEADLRALLRNNPLPGAISISLEREPNYFPLAGVAGAEEKTIIATENERLICMGRCSVRARFINERPLPVGYLSELRLDSGARGRFDILRRGYQFWRKLYAERQPVLWFTSIGAENKSSRRFLERGLKGMPKYCPLGDFVTLLIPVTSRLEPKQFTVHFRRQGIEVVQTKGPTAEFIRTVNTFGQKCNCATFWSDNATHQHAPWSDSVLFRKGGRAIACGTLWDQRPCRQTVIKGYNRAFSLVRPLVNLCSRVFGTPRLPAPGSVLSHAFLSPFHIASDHLDLLPLIIQYFRALASKKGIEFLTLGFGAEDPRLSIVRRHFLCREYRSCLYSIHWEGDTQAPLSSGVLFPEVALL